MKKIVALVLCLVLALSLCTVAFAAAEYDLYDIANNKVADAANVTYSAAAKPNYVNNVRNSFGNVAYYTYNAEKYAVVADANDADFYLVEAGTAASKLAAAKKIYLNKVDGVESVEYVAEASAYTNIGYECGQLMYAETLKVDGTKETVITYVHPEDPTKAAKVGKVTKTQADIDSYVLYKGEVVGVDNYDADKFVDHIWAASKFDTVVPTTPVEFKCGRCGVIGKVFDTEFAAKEAGLTPDTATYGDIDYVIGVAKTASTGSTTTVESAKTFDAGIALYAGMALASVAGSAVVIGKKKEF